MRPTASSLRLGEGLNRNLTHPPVVPNRSKIRRSRRASSLPLSVTVGSGLEPLSAPTKGARVGGPSDHGEVQWCLSSRVGRDIRITASVSVRGEDLLDLPPRFSA